MGARTIEKITDAMYDRNGVEAKLGKATVNPI